MAIFIGLKAESKYTLAVKRGIYLRENSVKGINFDSLSTLFSNPLFKHRY